MLRGKLLALALAGAAAPLAAAPLSVRVVDSLGHPVRGAACRGAPLCARGGFVGSSRARRRRRALSLRGGQGSAPRRALRHLAAEPAVPSVPDDRSRRCGHLLPEPGSHQAPRILLLGG